MSLAFLVDEHVKHVFVVELRANGYDVAGVGDGFDAGAPDADLLEVSVSTGRTILTNDSDFVRLHDGYDHGGIVVYSDQDMSVTAFISGIRSVERFVPEGELRGNVVWLDEWTR